MYTGRVRLGWPLTDRSSQVMGVEQSYLAMYYRVTGKLYRKVKKQRLSYKTCSYLVN